MTTAHLPQDALAHPALAALIGKDVGFLSLTKPKSVRQQYDYAAWYAALTLDVGVFPVVLERAYLSPHQPVLVAHVPATVTSSYTEAHFGGVPLRGKHAQPQYEKHRDVGQKREWRLERGLVEALAEDVVSIDAAVRFVIFPAHWSAVEDYARAVFEDKVAWAEKCREEIPHFLAGERPEGSFNRNLDDALGTARVRYAQVAEAAEALRCVRRTRASYRDGAGTGCYADNVSAEAAQRYVEGLCKKCFKQYLPGHATEHEAGCVQVVTGAEVRS